MVASLLSLKVARCIRFRQHDTMTACWVWTGYYNHGVPSTHGTTARRAVWTKMRGELPDTSILRTTCGHDDCVNPHHMRIATRRVAATAT